MPDSAASPWADALSAAALMAVDPAGLGGVLLHAPSGPVRDRWLAALRQALPAAEAMRRQPLHVRDDRLLGGLDLAASLQAGRPIAQRGLLAQTDGGVVIAAMAERLPEATAARLAAVMDSGEVMVEREGLTERHPCRIGFVALDEGREPDERVPQTLIERLAFHVDLGDLSWRDAQADVQADIKADGHPNEAAVLAARLRLNAVQASDAIVQALCAAALALGVHSLRASILVLRAARASAALNAHDQVMTSDAALAARLVLGPRATSLPQQEPPPAEPPSEDASEEQKPKDATAAPAENDADDPVPHDAPLDDVVLQAARAAIPSGLLAQLMLAQVSRSAPRSTGRSGRWQAHPTHGRPLGAKAGELRGGARLDLIATLRAAAPWQRLRREESPASARVQIRKQDFQVTRCQQRSETTTLFVVDASGSSAAHRLAEAKGAVELLLVDSYVRRDRVAVIAFRGRSAELLLPPTRSLVRAKRSLAGLPGGGGTPLAAALDAVHTLVEAITRHGGTPLVVLLTDGCANVARDGCGGRAKAQEEALQAAGRLRASRVGSLLIDTSPQPRADARHLAEALHANYLPLPHADARALTAAVRASQAAQPQRTAAAL